MSIKYLKLLLKERRNQAGAIREWGVGVKNPNFVPRAYNVLSPCTNSNGRIPHSLQINIPR